MGHTHPPIIVISGSMGSGKGTIVHALVNELSLTWVRTHTTRPIRKDDTVISRRFFDTDINFLRLVDRGDILVPTKIAGHYYGLYKPDLENELRMNHAVVIEITVDGGVALAKEYPNCLLFFIHADPRAIPDRVAHRTMSETEIKERLQSAKQEFQLAKQHYDYLIENVEGHPEEAIETIKAIICERFPDIKSTDV